MTERAAAVGPRREARFAGARWAALAFFVALAVRLIAIWVVGPVQLEFGDAHDFLETSRIVCTQEEYPATGNLTFFRAPGYPLFVSLVTACHPDRILRVKVCNALVDSLTVVLIWVLAGQMVRSAAGQLLASAVAAFHPIFVVQTTDVRSESIFMFLVTGALVALFAARTARPRWLLLAGALLGLAALTRPAALVAIPFFAVAWVIGSSSGQRRAAVASAVLLVAAAAAVVGPWSIYISERHHELIFVNDAGGYNLWRGTHPDLISALNSPDRRTYQDQSQRFELVTSPSEAVAVSREADSPMGRSRAWRLRAQERIASDPIGFVAALGGNLWRLWRPWLNPLGYPNATVLASAAFLLPMLFLGTLGLSGLRSAQPWLFGFVACWFLVVSLSHIPFQAVMRFRMPFTDPILIALMWGGLTALRASFSRGTQRPASDGRAMSA